MVGKMKSWRVWGLIFNFIGNALAIYGLAGLVRDGSRLPVFLVGAGVTLVCILVLAKPSPD
jgi:hypothetical protein